MFKSFCSISGGAICILEEEAPNATILISNADGAPYRYGKMLSLGIWDVGWYLEVGKEREAGVG